MHQSARIRRDKDWEPAVIRGIHEAPPSLIVTTLQGGVYRNCRHLLPTSESPPNILGPDYDKEIVVCEAPRPENVVGQQPRTSNRTVRFPERYRNDYVIWNKLHY